MYGEKFSGRVSRKTGLWGAAISVLCGRHGATSGGENTDPSSEEVEAARGSALISGESNRSKKTRFR